MADVEKTAGPGQKPRRQTAHLGTVWELETSEPVTIDRPDGSSARVSPRSGVARHVLDVAGTYRCGHQQITAK